MIDSEHESLSNHIDRKYLKTDYLLGLNYNTTERWLQDKNPSQDTAPIVQVGPPLSILEISKNISTCAAAMSRNHTGGNILL